ncbi:hypothetical protein [Lacticaseibacillus mingshuiensis]|uniref:hypothetical protein n=1 Tax=Lacticaseibacillus mingshuiensis TaxID=2799574 RepID=UPI00194E5A32|nr:hypothetical protein [Lacticaseibacillus mingshuiensis]
MTRKEKIDFIVYRFAKRDPEYPVERVQHMSDYLIDKTYEVEASAEEKEMDEAVASL